MHLAGGPTIWSIILQKKLSKMMLLERNSHKEMMIDLYVYYIYISDISVVLLMGYY